jgi:hypothetical protein
VFWMLLDGFIGYHRYVAVTMHFVWGQCNEDTGHNMHSKQTPSRMYVIEYMYKV